MQCCVMKVEVKNKKFKTYKGEERKEDGFEKAKRTREKQKERENKRNMWESL